MKKIAYILLAISIIFSACKKEEGCTDPIAVNYNADAEEDDGSCIFCVDGCTDSTACNYDPTAQCDDGSCSGLLGCTDPLATNYDINATCDDSSCTYTSTLSLVVTGDTLVTGNPNGRLTSYLNVENISNKTIDVACSITTIINEPTTEFSFCWGGACYGVGTLVSGQLATLTSGQLVKYPDAPAHQGYYDAFGLSSIGKIEYCFYDDANPADETCFTVTFNAVTGIEENPTNK